MGNSSESSATQAWENLERSYQATQTQARGFVAEAGLIGASMISDVPTRIEYMKMIRAEADTMLAKARANRESAQQVFNYMTKRRDELRAIQQGRASAVTNIISKLLTKNRSTADLLIKAAKQLAAEGKISVQIADGVSDVDALKALMTSDEFDDVLIKAINNAGGSRKTITPTNMKMRGGGLLFLTVALAGFDIYMSEDKSFATSKNVASIAGGAGGAWAFAAVGLAVGGPVGGVVGLIVGGLVGSFAAEEAHFHARGLNVNPRIDKLVQKHHGWLNFDEDALAYEVHSEFLGDINSVFQLFFHLSEKRSNDSDDVARTYIKVAQKVIRQHPEGALSDALKSPAGQALIDLLHSILDGGWTTNEEYSLMKWLKDQKL